MAQNHEIAASATIMDPNSFVIGAGSVIGDHVVIKPRVTIGGQSSIGLGSNIGENSYFGNNVIVGPGVKISSGALLLDGARVCPSFVTSGSTDARTLLERVSVGSGVLLHGEVELGADAIIPSQRTIASMGTFGDKNRVVTIYGSDTGPKISVGCNIGSTTGEIFKNVITRKNTTGSSADTYAPFLPIFRRIGRVVQKAYDKEGPRIAELKAMRQELLPLTLIDTCE